MPVADSGRGTPPRTSRTQSIQGKPMVKFIADFFPVIGSLILFFSWVVQQTLLRSIDRQSQVLSSAESVYRTYQSNNAVFNGLVELAGRESEKAAQIRRFQIYNYELGLVEMDRALSPAEHHDIPAAPFAYDESEDIDTIMQKTQTRLKILQNMTENKRKSMASRQADAGKTFMTLYIIGTIIVIIGAAFKAYDSWV
jgi:hypothetical protein